ncbi:hypothetical protein SOVF_107910 [Spinacia oleracea]|nr:hypothetical protein SOVF_107910 [Spinacia oleracea]
MEIAGIVLSAAQTLFAVLQCSEVKQVCSILGCKSQLNDLSGTVVRIKAALEDAEAKQELSKQDRLFIEELKDAVYDADDLFDEFVTLAEQEKLTKGIKVRVLALFGKYGTAYNMAQGVKMIKKKLDAIASDTRFNFNIDSKPIRNRRLETCSYVYEADIIGREPDLEKIVCVLLDPIVQQNVSFLPIVGMGGLGKTALAQLVFNDARVKNAFPLMLWACVADENQKLLDVQGVLGCNNLSYMPRGMGKLTCLHTLNKFVVGNTRSNKELFSGLEDLKALTNLKGYLEIDIHFMDTGVNVGNKNGDREGDCLGNKEHLKDVYFYFSRTEGKGREEYDEAVMGELQPHPNLEKFMVNYYRGVRMPRWPIEDNLATFLPNLVHMELMYCPNLQYSGHLRLPLLKILAVGNCPNLLAILQCPGLEVLYLRGFNKRLEIIRRIKSKEFGEATPGGIPASSSFSHDIGLKVTVDNVAWLNSLRMDSFLGLGTLIIRWDKEVESLGEAREAFRRCSSSLISLKIENCFKLKSVVFGGLEHLTALETLKIKNCSNLSLSEEVEREDGMPWQPFHHPLRSLKLDCVSDDLPNWIQYLTSLQTLKIGLCPGLESLPKWMSKLTSLKKLELMYWPHCPREGYQQSTGDDLAHIQHIPEIKIRRHY